MPRLHTAGAVLQSPLNLSDDHLDGDRVVATARHYHIGVALAWLDELIMHRLNGGQILLDDLIERSSAIVRVPLDSANEPDVGIRVDEYLDVAKFPHSRVDEQQDAVDDDYVRGLDARRLDFAQMSDEVVLRLVDRLPPGERLEMCEEQIIVERVRVVPIEFPALAQSE